MCSGRFATAPAWTKKPADLTDEDYVNFYKELYPYNEAPLFWIHLNVDYPFNLTGILYFPKIKQSYEIQKDKIQLYSNQVFVTDEVKDIVPEFLMLLQGVLDSPDIPKVDYARDIISRFATRAYRRPARMDEVDRLAKFVQLAM